jgi:hypothetical protein
VYKSTIPTVFGTQTEGTYALTGNINIPALYDGLTINYYLPYSMTGTGPATLNLTLSNGTTTGAKSIYLRSGYLLGEQYFSGDTIQMTFYSAGSITKNGTPTIIDMWICQGETGMVRHTNLSNSANFEYPLLMGTPTPLAAYSIAGKSYGNLSYNPSTTTLTATKFAGDISACTGLSGTSVSYSNTNSGLTATDVQDAIDEVNDKITDDRQLYTYRVPNVGNNITIRMTVQTSGEQLIHIVGAVANGQAFYDSIITCSASTGTIYCRNNSTQSLGNPIITNNVVKFTVADWTQMLVTSLHPISEITKTPT